MEKKKPALPACCEMEGGFTQTSSELRQELLRRLDLLNREIQALDVPRAQQLLQTAVEALHSLESELREQLAGELELEAAESRLVILAMWRQYRREFEILALRCRQTYPARQGRRDLGPHW